MNTLKVLIIEDTPEIAELLSDSLRINGFKPLVCSRGYNVISIIQALHPQIILLDLKLPDTTGFELCREIRLFSDVPVIMMSGKASHNDRLESFRVGADDFIEKPFCTKELILRVDSVAKRSSVA